MNSMCQVQRCAVTIRLSASAFPDLGDNSTLTFILIRFMSAPSKEPSLESEASSGGCAQHSFHDYRSRWARP